MFFSTTTCISTNSNYSLLWPRTRHSFSRSLPQLFYSSPIQNCARQCGLAQPGNCPGPVWLFLHMQ